MWIPLLLSAIIGTISWHGNATGLCATPLLFLLWGSAGSRIAAFSIASTYYLSSSYGLVHGAAVFFQQPLTHHPSLAAGVLLWGASGLLLALPWGILWGTTAIPVRIIGIMLLISLPPLGIFGWANPLTAAGALFPASGWLGLAMTLWLFILLATKRYAHLIVPALVSLLLTCVYQPKLPPPAWIAINTEFGWLRDDRDDFARHQQLLLLIKPHLTKRPQLILFPEMIVGAWTENSAWLWRDITRQAATQHTIILLGTTITEKTGYYSNALLALGDSPPITLTDRIPVPISMWHPWTRTGARSYFLHNGIYSIAGKKVASLICYEQLLLLPVLHSMIYQPDVLIGAANDWWAKNTTIPAIQQEALHAWGRLFNVPVLSSVNQ
jgi:hypothetical protein